MSRGGAGAGAGPDRGPDTRSHSRGRSGRRSSTPDSQRSGRRASSREVDPVDYSRGGTRKASGYAVQGTLHSTKSPTDQKRRRRLTREDIEKHNIKPYDLREENIINLFNKVYPGEDHSHILDYDPTDNPHGLDYSQTETNHSHVEYMSGYDGSQTEDDSW